MNETNKIKLDWSVKLLSNYILNIFKVQIEGSTIILTNWQTLNSNKKAKQTPKQVKEPPVSDVSGSTPNDAINDASEDLDSDDDEFPAYDMSNDTKVDSNKKKKILYLREVIEELGNPER